MNVGAGFPHPFQYLPITPIVKYNPHIHHRQSIRLRGYDYSQPGSYFITICTQHRECNLGELINGEIQFTVRGMIASLFWLEIPHHFPNVELDQFILMPNHIHGIIVIRDSDNIGEINNRETNPKMGGETNPKMGGETHRKMGGETNPKMGGETHRKMGGETPPLQDRKPTLGQIIAYYKYRTTKIINQIDDTPGQRMWQRNFYDRIIRTEKALHIMRQYIINNPYRWKKDLYNPRRGGVSPP